MMMTNDVTLAVGYTLAVGSVASLLLMWIADWRERCFSRNEVTRFGDMEYFVEYFSLKVNVKREIVLKSQRSDRVKCQEY
jgi:hypothetical protein